MDRFTTYKNGWRVLGDGAYMDDAISIRGEAVDRLSSYEDTGLTPEEIREKVGFMSPVCVGCDGKTDDGKRTDKCTYEKDCVKCLERSVHLCELAQAESEGRLIVLPCKVGDTVYVPVERCRAGINLCPYDGGYGTARCDGDKNCGAYVSAKKFSVRDYLDIGKTVFLTREEAEAALAKEAHNGE